MGIVQSIKYRPVCIWGKHGESMKIAEGKVSPFYSAFTEREVVISSFGAKVSVDSFVIQVSWTEKQSQVGEFHGI